jgi:hypothetical protein
MKKLPLGRQSFEDLRSNDCLYVDKTEIIHRVISDGKVYFLSRPRRFGKSLLISTMEALFKGRKDYNKYAGKVILLGIAFSGKDVGCRMEELKRT